MITRAFDHRFGPKGMTTTQYAILGTLRRQGDLPLTVLADELGMDRTSLYRTITPLERHGWVAVVAGGGRAKIARLTDAGRAARDAAYGDWVVAQEQVLGGISSEEWSTFLVTLDRLMRAADA